MAGCAGPTGKPVGGVLEAAAGEAGDSGVAGVTDEPAGRGHGGGQVRGPRRVRVAMVGGLRPHSVPGAVVGRGQRVRLRCGGREGARRTDDRGGTHRLFFCRSRAVTSHERVGRVGPRICYD